MSESLFAHLFDISPFPAVVSRLGDKGVLAINERTSEMFGIPHAEAVGRFTTDYYVNPADRRCWPSRWSATTRRTSALARLVSWNGERC